MTDIHPTAIIDPSASIGENVKIGPYCVIGAHVELGSDCILHSHVVLGGPSKFGKGNEFFPFSVIGLKTQDLKYKCEPTFLEVGDYNVFRENCNINRSTTPETKTVIGSHNNFLINSHCGHECQVGDHCILSGYAALAGHCVLGDHAIISGCSAVHQFTRIGEHSLVAGLCRVTQDVPPYTIVEGTPPSVRAINSVGLLRRGYTEGDVRALKYAYKKLFLHKTSNKQEAMEEILAHAEYGQNACVGKLVDFLNSSERGFTH